MSVSTMSEIQTQESINGSIFFKSIQMNIEEGNIEGLQKTFKRLFVAVGSPQANCLLKACSYFNKITSERELEAKTKNAIIKVFLNFLENFPADPNCVKQRIAYLHSAAKTEKKSQKKKELERDLFIKELAKSQNSEDREKLEEQKIKKLEELQRNLLPYYTLILHIAKGEIEDIRKNLSRLFQRFVKKNMHFFNAKFSKALSIDLEDGNSSFTQFKSCLDTIKDLQQYGLPNSFIGDLYINANTVLTDSKISSEDMSCERQKLVIEIEEISHNYYSTSSFYINSSPTERLQQAVKEYRDIFEKKFEECSRDFQDSYDPQIVRNFQKEQYERFCQFFKEKLLKGPYFAFLEPFPFVNDSGQRRPTYDFRVVGSLGREEMCPLSDIEGFILVEKKSNISFFQKVSAFLRLELVTLGECDPPDSEVLKSTDRIRKGLSLDLPPGSDFICISTPEEMAAQQNVFEESYECEAMEKEGVPFAYSLLKSESLHGNSTLFSQYQEELQRVFYSSSDEKSLQQIRAEKFLKFRLMSFKKTFTRDFDQEFIFNIKEQFVELLNHVITDLSLYFDVEETNTLDIIDALVSKKVFTEESGILLKKTIAAIYLLRVHLQFLSLENSNVPLEQCRRGSLEAPEAFRRYPVLEIKQEKLLAVTYWLVLKPLYKKIESFLDGTEEILENIDLLNKEIVFDDKTIIPLLDYCADISKTNIFETILPFLFERIFTCDSPEQQEELIRTIARREFSEKAHVMCYQRLSQKNNVEFLRKAYLEEIKKQKRLFHRLEFIPNSDGYRQIEVRKRLQLQETIKSLTVENEETFQGFSVLIDGPTLSNTDYLKKEVLERILDAQGNLKKEQSGTNNNVVHLELDSCDLYFKQQPLTDNQSPFHPGTEQAVSRFMMRVFGHGVSFSELVSFTVMNHQKNISKRYLVLISETVKGNTLKEIVEKSPKRLQELDEKRLSEVFLSIPLILPGDAREVNYIFEETEDEERNPISQLVSIDNDVAWGKLIVDEGRVWSKPVCKLYTVLFSYFPGFILDKKAIETFLEIKLKVVISWLEELIEWNKKTKEKFRDLELPDFINPICVFDEAKALQIIMNIFHLQEFLKQRRDKDIEALEILRSIESSSGKLNEGEFLYKKYRTVQRKPPEQIKTITGRDSSVSISMSDSSALYQGSPEQQQQEDYQLESDLNEVRLFINMDVQDFSRKEGDFAELKKGFRTEKGTPPINEITQRLLLQELLKYKYSKLNLSCCQVLTDEDLQIFLKKSGKELISLDLRECPKITDQIIKEISEKCPNLEELYLSGCNGLLNIRGWLPRFLDFRELKVLDISGCKNLKGVRINAPKLQDLNVGNNPNLEIIRTTIKFCESTLIKLVLEGCKQLKTNEPFVFPNLEVLDISGCENLGKVGIKAPKLRELRAHNNPNPRAVGEIVTSCKSTLEILSLIKYETLGVIGKDEGLTFPRLEVLDIRGCKKLERVRIKAPNLRALRMKENGVLKELFLNGCDQLEAIGEDEEIVFPRLEALRISSCENLERVRMNAPNLQKLIINNNSNRIAIKDMITSYKDTLEELVLDGCEQLEAIGEDEEVVFPSLEVLDIRGCEKLERVRIEAPKLRKLNLENNSNRIAIKDMITSYKDTLEELVLDGCDQLEAIGEDEDLVFPNLEVLDIKGCEKLEKARIKAPKLRELRMKENGVLKELVLDGCERLTAIGEDEALVFPNLEVLDIKGCENLESVQIKVPKLRKLWLENGFKLFTIKEMITSCTGALKELSLIKCEQFKTIGENKNLLLPRLESLDIRGCENLERLRIGAPKLRKLNLENNSKLITIKETIDFCIGTLKGLSLINCEQLETIGGGENLIFQRLESLNGGEQLAAIEKYEKLSFPSLEFLDISGCKNLEKRQIKAPKLRKLKIDNNSNRIAIKETIIFCLDTLEELVLNGCERLTAIGEEEALVFPKLEVLDIKGCEKLEKVQIKTPNLQELRSENNPELINIEETIASCKNTLKNLFLSDCKQLSVIEENDENLVFPILEILDISGCESLKKVRIIALNLRKIRTSNNFSLLELSLKCKELEALGEEEALVFPKLEILKVSGCENLEKVWIKASNLRVLIVDFILQNHSFKLTTIKETITFCMDTLEELSLKGCKQLKTLGKDTTLILPKLKSLDIRGCENLEKIQLEASNLQKIKTHNNNSLKELFLKCEQFQIISLRNTLHFENLEILDIRGCRNLDRVEINAPKLRALRISNSPYLTSLLRIAITSHDLEELYLSDCKKFDMIPFFPKLKSLDIRGCENLRSVLIAPLELRVLRIMDCNPRNINQIITYYKNTLVELCLANYNQFEILDEKEALVFPKLEVLDISGCKNLERVRIKAPRLLKIKANNTSLKELSLNGCERLTAIGEDEALVFPNLEVLEISECTNLENARIIAPKLLILKIARNSKLGFIRELIISCSNNLKEFSLIELELSKALFDVVFPYLEIVHVSKCKNLERLQIEAPNLLELKIDNTPKLTIEKTIVTYKDSITKISLSRCDQLEAIEEDEALVFSKLEVLEISECTNLKNARIIAPNLRSLKIARNSKLGSIREMITSCTNTLEELSLSKCEQLETLGKDEVLTFQKLEVLDISECVNLENTGIIASSLRILKINHSLKLITVEEMITFCTNTLEELSLSKCEQLETLGKDEGIIFRKLKFLNISTCENLTKLSINAPKLCRLIVQDNPQLLAVGETLTFCKDSLEELSLSKCEQLEVLGEDEVLTFQKLEVLEINECVNLENTGIIASSLRILKINHSLKLITVEEMITSCTNMLEELSLSKCEQLETLGKDESLVFSKLEVLEISECINLENVQIIASNLRILKVNHNPKLVRILKNSPQYTNILEEVQVLKKFDFNRRSQFKTLETREKETCTFLEKIFYLRRLGQLEIKRRQFEINWEQLEIIGEDEALVFPKLEVLEVNECTKLENIQVIAFNLRSLKIDNSSKFIITEETITSCTSTLEELSLNKCDRLEALGKDKTFQKLEILDIRNCENLKKIRIKAPRLLKIKANNTSLKELSLNGCERLTAIGEDEALVFPKLEVLEISECTNLKNARIIAPNLRSLKIAHNSKLGFIREMIISCRNNLKELSLIEWELLKTFFDIVFPNLEVLHVNKCKNLERLQIKAPNLLELKIDNNPKLAIKETIIAYKESVTKISLSKCEQLEVIEEDEALVFSKLEVLEISECTNLKNARIIAPNLRSLKIAHNSKLGSIREMIISCRNNLKELSLIEWERLKIFFDIVFPNLEVLHVNKCKNLERLQIKAPNLLELKIDNNPKLAIKETIIAYKESVTKISLSKCEQLETLGKNEGIVFRKLKFLNISACENLTRLSVNAPNLCRLIVQDNPQLLAIGETLTFCKDSLEELSLTGSKHLEAIEENEEVVFSKLEVLEISECTNLTIVWIKAPNLRELKAENNLKLLAISETLTFCKDSLALLFLSKCGRLEAIEEDEEVVFSKLEVLDIKECENLERLSINAPNLCELEAENNLKLLAIGETLAFCKNSLEKLFLSRCERLEAIEEDEEVVFSKLEVLDIKECENLERLSVNAPNLCLLGVYENPKLIVMCETLTFCKDSLAGLILSKCGRLEAIEEDEEVVFSKLEVLEIDECENLERLSINAPNLCELQAKDNPKLLAIGETLAFCKNSLEKLSLTGSKHLEAIEEDEKVVFSKLKVLEINECENLTIVWINVPNLCELEAKDNPKLIAICETLAFCKDSLEKLVLSGCRQFEAIEEDEKVVFSKLDILDISTCENLTKLWINAPNLRELRADNTPNLAIKKAITFCKDSLEELYLSWSEQLEAIGDETDLVFPKLQVLGIRGCKDLERVRINAPNLRELRNLALSYYHPPDRGCQC